MVKRGAFVSQLFKTVEEHFAGLEKSYDEKDVQNFNKNKKIILEMQKKILEELNE